MAQVVPTITAPSLADYQELLSNVRQLTNRLHIDFGDGEFTPQRLINLIEAHWPAESLVDVHLMYKKPDQHLPTLISMNPHMVIIHAEATADFRHFYQSLSDVGIKTGLALLQDTAVETVAGLITTVDQVLVFTGKLGYYGGQLDSSQLVKIKQVKAINPGLEVAVDGGINDHNAAEVARAGADILNVGGYIQQAEDPKTAFETLDKIVAEVTV